MTCSDIKLLQEVHTGDEYAAIVCSVSKNGNMRVTCCGHTVTLATSKPESDKYKVGSSVAITITGLVINVSLTLSNCLRA